MMRILPAGVCLLVIWSSPLSAAGSEAQPGGNPQDLKTLSLEELLELEVTTVSRSPERRIDTPAAVSVITGEDIRRYGVDTLADALRLADSVSVSRFNGGSWAIATRGFSAITNNKMLVMIDGRSVYTPLFGGVFWEAQHMPMPDIERIEIIRGPAGTLWGPNAVNGVINIITKPASDTPGALVRGVTGSRERAHVVARYGGRLSPRGSYRVFVVGSEFDSPQMPDGSSAREDRRLRQGGARFDWDLDNQAHFTVQGDGLMSRMGLADRDDSEIGSGNVVATYTRQIDPGSSLQILGYVDAEHREVPLQSWENRTTVNVDGQHATRLTPRYHLIWGGGARSTVSRTRPTPVIFFEPQDRTIHQVHGFGQMEIALWRNFSLTAGSRGERTTFSGFELQPSVRVKYTPQEQSLLWAAVSRAVRTPTRFDQDLRIQARIQSTDVVVIRGDHGFRREQLVAYETGARFMMRGNVSVEASGFYHDYDDLRSQEGGQIPIRLANLYDGYTTGIELAGNLQPHSRLLLHASYTGQRVALRPGPGSRDVSNARAEADDPSHMFSIRSYLNLPGGVEADAFLRAIGKLRASNLPGYRELDLRVGVQLDEHFDVALVGRDLLHDRHAEFAGGGSVPKYFQREVAVRLTWHSR